MLDDSVVNDVFYQCSACHAYCTSISSWSNHSLKCVPLSGVESSRPPSFQLVTFAQPKVLITKLPEESLPGGGLLSAKRRRVGGNADAASVARKHLPDIPGGETLDVAPELGNFLDRVLISSDGNVVHCKSERLDLYHQESDSDSSDDSDAGPATGPSCDLQNDSELDYYDDNSSSIHSYLYPSESSINDNGEDNGNYQGTDRKDRKRDQNRTAARRYRWKMCLQLKALEREEGTLQQENEKLRKEKCDMEDYRNGIRGLVRDKLQQVKRSRHKAAQIPSRIQKVIPKTTDVRPLCKQFNDDHSTVRSNFSLSMALINGHTSRNPSTSSSSTTSSSSSFPIERRGRPRKGSASIAISDPKERKKAQNKKAAVRYRKKRQEELNQLLKQEDQLDLTNAALKRKVDEVRRQVQWTRGLVRAKITGLKNQSVRRAPYFIKKERIL